MDDMFKRKDKAGEGHDRPDGPGESPPGAAAAATHGGEELAILREQVEKLTAERDEAQQRYLRSLADFQNYQRRAIQNEQVARAEGAGRIARDIVNVIDHFDLALAQDLTKLGPGAGPVLDGLKVIREELMKTLGAHGVALITPAKNDEFEPGRHEAIMQQADPDTRPGRIVATFQPGYTLSCAGLERVIRPAKVSVAPSEG